MSDFKSLQVYLSEEQMNQLIEFADDSGLSRSKLGKKIIVDFLENYTSYTPKPPASGHDVVLASKVQHIEHRLNQLEALVQINQEQLAATDKLSDNLSDDLSQAAPTEQTTILDSSGESSQKLTKENLILKEQEAKIKAAMQQNSELDSPLENGSNLVSEEEETGKNCQSNCNTFTAIEEAKTFGMFKYVVVCRCADQLLYWGGNKIKHGNPKLEYASLYSSEKSAKNAARKASAREEILYTIALAWGEFSNYPDDKKQAVYDAWEIDKKKSY